MYSETPAPAGRRLVGVEAVIDKDLACAMLAADLGADALLIVTDVDAVYTSRGTSQQQAIRRATPKALAGSEFAAGSMAPKFGCLRLCQRDRRTGCYRVDCRHAGLSAR